MALFKDAEVLSLRQVSTGEQRKQVVDWGGLPIGGLQIHKAGVQRLAKGTTGALHLGRQKFSVLAQPDVIRVVHSTLVFSSNPRWGVSRDISHTLDLHWVGAFDGDGCAS